MVVYSAQDYFSTVPNVSSPALCANVEKLISEYHIEKVFKIFLAGSLNRALSSGSRKLW